MRHIALVALLCLAGCAGTPEVRAIDTVAVACGTIGQGEKELAPYVANNKLTDAQVALLVEVRNTTRPVCAKDSKVDPATVVDYVKAAAGQLTALVALVKGQ